MTPIAEKMARNKPSRRGKFLRAAAKLLEIALEPKYTGKKLLTLDEIAEKTGRTKRSCYEQLKRMDMTALIRGSTARGEDIIELLDRVGDLQLNRVEAANELGMPYSYVAYYARKLGLMDRFRTDLSGAPDDKFKQIMAVINESEEKLSIIQVMEKTGFSRSVVGYHLRNHRHLVMIKPPAKPPKTARPKALKPKVVKPVKVKKPADSRPKAFNPKADRYETKKASKPVQAAPTVKIKVDPPASNPFNSLLKRKF